MKSVFAIALFSIVCSNVSFAAQPADQFRPPMRNILIAGLTSFNVDSRESFVGANGGNVSIDLTSRTITLSFQRSPICNPGQACPRFLQNLGTITLPLVGRQVDSCGGVTYKAGRDLRRVDGSYQELEVSDNTTNRCPHFAQQLPTSIVFTDVPARASFNEQRVSTFSASQLRQSMMAAQ